MMSQQRGETQPKKPPPLDPIKVVVRIRGLNQYELGTEVKGNFSIKNSIARSWKVKDGRRCVQTTNTGESLPGKEGRTCFTYDKVFDEHASTKEVFDESARDIINSFVNGISGTIIAYGQTGCGKTYTMQGKGSLKDGALGNAGVIHMSIKALFEGLAQQHSSIFLLRATVIEVYNEEIRDLLLPSDEQRKVTTRYDSKAGIGMDATENFVTDYSSMIDLFSLADENRSVRKTGMNDRSSRSHTIYKITLEKKQVDDSDGAEMIQISTMNLVDLAGSDRVMKKTGIQDDTQKEGSNINKSLLALSHVISDLGRSRKGFVNFRDSNLTKVLQKDLKSHCRIAVICCITPSGIYTEQTRKTLEFGKHAGGVQTRPGRAIVKDNRSIIIKTLRDLYNTRSSPRASDEKKEEAEMKWKEIERAFIIGEKTNTVSDPNRKDEGAKVGAAWNEKDTLRDDDCRDDVAQSRASEEDEECELSIVLSVAQQKMTEIEEEWELMKCGMDERSLASRTDFGSFEGSKSSIPNEIEFEDADECMFTSKLENTNESGLSRHKGVKQEDGSNTNRILEEIVSKSGEIEDISSALISSGSEESDYLTQNTTSFHAAVQGRILPTMSGLSMKSEMSAYSDESPETPSTHNTSPDVKSSSDLPAANDRSFNDSMGVVFDDEREESVSKSGQTEDDLSALIFSGSEESNYLTQNTSSGHATVQGRILPTMSGLSMESEISTPYTYNTSPDVKSSSDLPAANDGSFNDSMGVSFGNKRDLLTYSEDSASIHGKNKVVHKDTSNNLETSTTCGEAMMKPVPNLKKEHSGVLTIEELEAEISKLSLENKSINFEKEKRIQTLGIENEVLRYDIDEILTKLDHLSKQADQLPLLKESKKHMLKVNAELEEQVVALSRNLDKLSKQADQLPLLEESKQHMLKKNAELEEHVVTLSRNLHHKTDQADHLQLLEESKQYMLKKNAELEEQVALLTEKLSSYGDGISKLEPKASVMENILDQKDAQSSDLSLLSAKLKERDIQVAELSTRVKELEDMLQNLEAARKMSDYQNNNLQIEIKEQFSNEEESILMSINSQKSEETSLQDSLGEEKQSEPSLHSSSKCSAKDDLEYTASNISDTSTSSDAITEVGAKLRSVLNQKDTWSSNASLDHKTEHQGSHEFAIPKEELVEQNLAEINNSYRHSHGESIDFDLVVDTTLLTSEMNEENSSGLVVEHNGDKNDNDGDKENSGAVLSSQIVDEKRVEISNDNTSSPKIVAAMKGNETMLKHWENLSIIFRNHRQQALGENHM